MRRSPLFHRRRCSPRDRDQNAARYRQQQTADHLISQHAHALKDRDAEVGDIVFLQIVETICRYQAMGVNDLVLEDDLEK